MHRRAAVREKNENGKNKKPVNASCTSENKMIQLFILFIFLPDSRSRDEVDVHNDDSRG